LPRVDARFTVSGTIRERDHPGEGAAAMVVKKAATDEAAAQKPAAAEPAAAKTAAGKTAKKGAAKKAAATGKSAAGEAPAKKATTRKAAAKTPARETTAGAAAGRKAPAKKAAAAKKSPAGKATANKTGARKVAAKKTVAKTAASESPVPAARSAAGPGTLAVLPGEDPWTPAEVEEARSELLGEVERLRAEIASSEAAVAGLLRDGGDSGGDEADTGSKNITREYELALAANTREMLTQADHALHRLDEGTYGLCEVCGNPIGKARMQAFPRATLCLDDKQRQERR
jgi:RNA polymerase-binding protein DksA